MIPIPDPTSLTDEQAKAVQQAAEFGTTVVREGSEFARYIGKILGTVPEDAVQLVLGQPLRLARLYVAEKIDERVEKLHKERGVKETQPVSPSIAIPLIQAAYDESRDELQDIWARLIAAAMDPNRTYRVRRRFIDTVKNLDPLDAVILKKRYEISGDLSPNGRDYMAGLLKVSFQEIEISAQNLLEQKCIDPHHWGIVKITLTTYGSELLRACMT